MESNGRVRAQFAGWLRAQEPEPLRVTPVIRIYLILNGWTPPDASCEELVALREFVARHREIVEVSSA
ncbi:hypothetical protein GCM10017691_24020 [Pseudonocardia petroleophila]|uniref:Uncharacterized protein n=1 Tax=Pseudonocardia petroleophila TaxID=37331 RepID=A0A7G7MFU1_9PSEU|nr:hypothetical protein [Pseudonocardia petroleophila]QNG51652.1 hypothetical protein H6H00_26690 [Pseudonocardia petroleophila]